MRVKLKKEDVNKGYLILINQDNLLQSKTTNLTSYSSEFKNIELERVANRELHLALDSIKAKNKIVPVSGYRTLEEQIYIYESSLKENGEEFTKKFVALPNASEHQTGFAIDLALNEEKIDFICPNFPYHGICQEFRNIAPEYGFIERYNDKKREITKISNEEWHFRYVGYPHSKIISNLDFCLEEYINYIKTFTYPNNPLNYEEYKIFYVSYKDNDYIELNAKSSISGNNVDGFILTIKEER